MDNIQQYCLRWNNHRANLLNTFDELLQNEAFTDVTIAVDGGSIKCHKMVLVACSSYFQNLFSDLPCRHPIVVLKDVKLSEIKAILEYMYRGEVNVAQEQLGNLLKVAEVLKVKGLVDEVVTPVSPPPAISTSTGAGGATHNKVHESPPHSTRDYCNFYNRHTSMERSRLSTMPWNTGMPVFAGSGSSYSQLPLAHDSNTSNIGYESMSQKCRKKLQSSCKLASLHLTSRDTPILRTVLGQGHVDSSQAIPLLHADSHSDSHFCSPSNNSTVADNDKRTNVDLNLGEGAHSPYMDVPSLDEDEKQRASPQSYAGDSKSGILNFIPEKPWKRYKQYSRDDIAEAIGAVRQGMSPVQAARKYGVPSRTLYDKVKKLGISTPRPFKRATNGGSGACFPYGIGGNVKGSIYSGSLFETENEIRESNSTNMLENVSMVIDTRTKETSQERDDSASSLNASQCSPNPAILCTQQEPNDEVEDLSVSRKPDTPIIVSPAIQAVKSESMQDTDKSDDRNDYN